MYGVGFGYGSAGATTILKSGASFDTDALNFFTAASITDATQKNAVNNLVLNLKLNNLWTKMKALYPIVGGNATAHSYNLKNTAQFQISFSSGWTHSADGMTPNGVSAYADTGFNPSVSLTLNNCGFSYYSRTNRTAITAAIGVYDSNNYQFCLFPRLPTDTMINRIATTVYTGDTYSGITDSRGLFTASRNTSSYSVLFRNGTSLGNGAVSSSGLPNYKFYIGALSYQNALQFPDNQQFSLNAIHEGLTNSEAATFYTLVQAFQTSLSRQV